MAYKQHVRSFLKYAYAAWNSASGTLVQRKAAWITCVIRRTDRRASTTGLFQKLDLKSLSERGSDR